MVLDFPLSFIFSLPYTHLFCGVCCLSLSLLYSIHSFSFFLFPSFLFSFFLFVFFLSVFFLSVFFLSIFFLSVFFIFFLYFFYFFSSFFLFLLPCPCEAEVQLSFTLSLLLALYILIYLCLVSLSSLPFFSLSRSIFLSLQELHVFGANNTPSLDLQRDLIPESEFNSGSLSIFSLALSSLSLPGVGVQLWLSLSFLSPLSLLSLSLSFCLSRNWTCSGPTTPRPQTSDGTWSRSRSPTLGACSSCDGGSGAHPPPQERQYYLCITTIFSPILTYKIL